MILSETAERIKKVVTRKLRIKSAFRKLFDPRDASAVLVLQQIIQEGYLNRCPFVAGDPYQTHVNIGQQRMAQSILNQITEDPQKLIEQIEKSYANSENARW